MSARRPIPTDNGSNGTRPPGAKRRAFLVGIALSGRPADEAEDHLNELAALADTAGAEIVGRAIQARKAPDPRLFVGPGKAAEIADEAKRLGTEVVVFDEDLSGSQAKNLEEILKLPVVDRSGLILEIFERRARSREARTQVELARLRYELPRLARKWGHLSRQVGGIGVRGGEGETQLEADRRVLRRRIEKLEEELVRIDRMRRQQRRGRAELPVVALAGYTNAGKSTLFNRLTRDQTVAEDRLFATLDSRLRRGALDGDTWPVLFADTVGFIRKLPHHLVASFRSTLGEVVEADLVLHVVDRSHPGWEEQQSVAEEVLAALDVDPERVLVAYNKADRLPPGEIVEPDALAVSALTGEGLDELRSAIADRLTRLRALPRSAAGRLPTAPGIP
ncbi:MAG: GTPase HflX [Acidobacteria bacterium]|nr:GTPase HflX [Acidobacteriota bacterium]MCB9377486.1 GTPase HflX [Holophagales bacterium]